MEPSNTMKQEQEFYIGWMPAAPQGLARFIRKVVLILALLVAGAGVSLALLQKKFSTARFEYGQLTEVKGIYRSFPVPSLKVMTKKDVFGNTSFITIPLVGYGKHGAEDVIAAIETETNKSLENREVMLKGTLLYSDGKTLLQIDSHDDPLVQVAEKTVNGSPAITRDWGTVQLTGEILDPKCYFGVMKPGRGKPHRDCAIRCIEGGMSPVFCVRNEMGEADYYLILGAGGRKMNSLLKDHIAEPVTLEARVLQYDDWVVLYVDGSDKIKPTGGLSWFKTRDETISCGPGKE